MDRRSLLGGGLLATMGLMGTTASPEGLNDQNKTVGGWPRPKDMWPIWPDGHVLGQKLFIAETVVERGNAGYHDRSLKGIATPRVAVFKPVISNGSAILIIPGGGYGFVGVDREGYEVAAQLNERGYTCFVLFYRLPSEGWVRGPDMPLADAQRAMRLIRSRASSLALDPQRITAIGFSAGGHLCAELSTRHAAAVLSPIDEIDRLSARPLASGLVYPVITMVGPYVHAASRDNLMGADASEAQLRLHSADLNVTTDTPPTFIVHALDDPTVAPDNSLCYMAALRSNGVFAEGHFFANGGHGFGLRQALSKPVAAWLDLFVRWHETL